jgi:hypothetical protein
VVVADAFCLPVRLPLQDGAQHGFPSKVNTSDTLMIIAEPAESRLFFCHVPVLVSQQPN